MAIINMFPTGAGGIKLAGIAITTPPTKTAYQAYEAFDSTGMVVMATFSNGATAVVGGYTATPATLSVGDTLVTITYTEGGVSRTATQAVTVTKISVPVPSVSGTLAYNGGAQSPTILNEPSTSVAARGGDASATNAGNYTKTYTLTDSTNYEWASAFDGNLAWSIGQKNLSITAKNQSITYGNSIATGVGQVTVSGLEGTDALNSITLTPSTSDVTSSGTITPSAAVVKNGDATKTGNYLISYSAGNLIISKATAVLITAPTGKSNLVYTGAAQELVNAGTASGGTLQYSLDGTNYSASIPTRTDANTGGYTVYYKVVGDANHNDTTPATLTVPIAKADFTATVSISDYTYGGTKNTPSVSANPGNGTVTYYGRASSGGTATAWGNVTATTYDAGTRYCYAVIADTANYNGYTTAEASFVIAKATPSVPALSETAITLNATTTSGSFTVTRDGDGAISAVSSDSSEVTVSVSGNTVTVNSIGTETVSVTITVTVAAGTNYTAYTGSAATCVVTVQFLTVYGASWDGTSTTAWTRTDAAASFTDPVPYVKNATSYGSPFDDLMPWSGMTRVTDSEAGEMVRIPKFWYKITQSGSGMSIQISDGEKDGFSVCPACMDRGDGSGERDYVLVGRYHCATSTYKSTSGVKPAANFTRSAGRTSISNLGSKVWMMDFATRFTIWLLYIVEFADWNSQAKIGYGCGNNSATGNMGYTDSMPYHTGTTQTSRTTYGLGTQYRNIEGLWDNVRDWIDGCYYNSSGLNIIKNPSSFSDSTGGTAVGVPSNGYPSAFSVKSVNGTFPMFIPTAASGSDSTYSCDYWSYSASYPCLSAGGHYNQYLYYGLFFIGYYSASVKYAYVGSRSLKLP